MVVWHATLILHLHARHVPSALGQRHVAERADELDWGCASKDRDLGGVDHHYGRPGQAPTGAGSAGFTGVRRLGGLDRRAACPAWAAGFGGAAPQPARGSHA